MASCQHCRLVHFVRTGAWHAQVWLAALHDLVMCEADRHTGNIVVRPALAAVNTPRPATCQALHNCGHDFWHPAAIMNRHGHGLLALQTPHADNPSACQTTRVWRAQQWHSSALERLIFSYPNTRR